MSEGTDSKHHSISGIRDARRVSVCVFITALAVLVSQSGCSESNDGDESTKVNGSIHVPVGKQPGAVATVNGSIQVDPIAAERIRKEAPFKILREERNEQGVTFVIEGGRWNWYVGWFLSFADHLRVVEPEDLRTLLYEMAQATADHHRTTTNDNEHQRR